MVSHFVEYTSAGYDMKLLYMYETEMILLPVCVILTNLIR